MHVGGIEGIAELEPILLEGKDFQLFVVEVAKELVAMTRETAFVQIMPDGTHQMDEVDILEMVSKYHLQVFVDTEEGYGIRIGQHVVFDAIHLPFGERVTVEVLGLTLDEALHRY